jgi:hypothetical protein
MDKKWTSLEVDLGIESHFITWLKQSQVEISEMKQLENRLKDDWNGSI